MSNLRKQIANGTTKGETGHESPATQRSRSEVWVSRIEYFGNGRTKYKKPKKTLAYYKMQ